MNISSIEADDCESQQAYLWHRGDYGRLSDALFRVNWKMEFMDLSSDLAYDIFLHIVNGLIDMYVLSCPNTCRVPWSVKPPAGLRVVEQMHGKATKI